MAARKQVRTQRAAVRGPSARRGRSRATAPGAAGKAIGEEAAAPPEDAAARPDEAGKGGEPGTPAWLLPLLERARERGRAKAAAVRARHPAGSKTRFALGEELVRRSALRAGLLGAATGTLALITLPVGLPAGIAATLFVEAELLFALLELYEIGDSGEVGRVRLAALWAGAGLADAAKSAGLRVSADLLGRAIAGTLPARLIARLEPVLLKAILKRFGLGLIPRLFKLWPLLGAPFAFALDRAALRTLGRAALEALERTEHARRRGRG